MNTLEYKILEKAKTFARERHETTFHEALVSVPIWIGVDNMGLPYAEELQTVYESITHIDPSPVPLRDIRAELKAPADEFGKAALATWYRMKHEEYPPALEKACTDAFESAFTAYLRENPQDLHQLLADAPPAESRALAYCVTPENPSDFALRNAVRACLARSEPDYASLYERIIDGKRHFLTCADLEIHEKKLCAQVPALLEKTFQPGIHPDAIYKKTVTALQENTLQEQSPAETRIERETWKHLNKKYFAAMVRRATYAPNYLDTFQRLLDDCAEQSGIKSPQLTLPPIPSPHKVPITSYVRGFAPMIAGLIGGSAGLYATQSLPQGTSALAGAGVIATITGSIIAGAALIERIEKANTLRNDRELGAWREACAQETTRYLQEAKTYLNRVCAPNSAYYPCNRAQT
jgi:hypothetical protein